MHKQFWFTGISSYVGASCAQFAQLVASTKLFSEQEKVKSQS